MRKKLLLRNVYSNLISEAILDQSTFLEKLLNIIESKPSSSGQYGKLVARIVKNIKDTNLLSLKGKENKKARKKAEIAIAKDLKEIKGIDGSPINIKAIKPLYDSLVQYMQKKSEANLDDCLKAADYYMKDFYPNVDLDEKSEIDDGNFEFDVIFRRTKFYQQYLEFKESKLGASEVHEVYEDDRIKIVYPPAPSSFNRYISSMSGDVSWCTQNPATWHAYNSRQFVMILHDKHSDVGDTNYLISLKVDKNGSVDYQGTCDYHNDHMGQDLVPLMSDNIESEIAAFVNSNQIDITQDVATYEELKSNVKGLVDINDFDQIESMFNVYIARRSFDHFELIIKTFLQECKVSEKYDRSIDLLAEVICDATFQDHEFSLNFDLVYLVSKNVGRKAIIDLGNTILMKAAEKRSHEKYYISFPNIFTEAYIESLANQIANFSNKLKNAFIQACDTNNPANFSRVLKESIKKDKIKSIVMPESLDDISLFKTKGFFNYIIFKNLNLLAPKDMPPFYDSVESYFNAGSSADEKYIRDLILNNKEEFSIAFEQNKSSRINQLTKKIGNTESKDEESKRLEKDLKKIQNLDLSDIDINLLIAHIVSSKDIENVDLSAVLKDSMYLQKSDVENTVRDLMTDFDFFTFMFNKNNVIGKKYLDFVYNKGLDSEYITKDSIKFIDYILQNLIGSGILGVYSLRYHITLASNILSICKKFNVSPQSLPSAIGEFILKLCIEDSYFLYHILKDDDSLDRFLGNVDYFVYLIQNKASEKAINTILEDMQRAVFDNRMTFFKTGHSTETFSETQDLIFQKFLSIDRIKNNISLGTETVNKRKIFFFFYLLSKDVLDKNTIINLVNIYVKKIITSEQSIFQDEYSRNHIRPIFCKLIADNISDSEMLPLVTQHVSAKSFYAQRTVSGSSAFKILVINLIKSLNNKNISFDKDKLSDIISDAQFASLPEHIGVSMLRNLVQVSSDGELNYLYGKDLTIVRDCLAGLTKNKSQVRARVINKKYISYIIEMVSKLNRVARMQISDMALKDQRAQLHARTEEEIQASNEALLKKYINMLMS